MGEERAEGKTQFLDVLRLVGILAVIILHTVSGVADNMSEQMSGTQLAVYTAIKQVCEIGVPLFLMVSGALMLDPEKNITIKLLFKKYLKRLVLALLIFGTVFAFGELIFMDASGSIPKLILRALKRVALGKSWAHLWFMYIIIGIYLLLPVLRVFTARADEKVFTYCIVLLIVMQSILPAVLSLIDAGFAVELPVRGIYLTYFLMGYYLRKYPLFSDANRKALYSVGTVVALWLIAVPFFRLMASETDLSVAGYSSPAVLVLSVVVYEWAAGRKKDSALCRIATGVRPYVFGMYLVHTVFINFLYKVLGVSTLLLGGYILIPVVAVFTFAFSFVVSYIMKKIPWFGDNVV